jgi:cell division septation protein DedD
MRTRGSRAAAAAALGVVALLSGCASFAQGIQETAGVAAAATTGGTASGTSGAASDGAAASSDATAASGATATSEPATGTAEAPAPATPRVSAPQAPAAPASWPPETALTANREVWGVYLVVAEDYTAAETARMRQVYRDLQALGYRGYSGTLCDAGAEDAGVDESADAVSVYFATKAQVQQFLTGWNRPYVGYARVATFCTD